MLYRITNAVAHPDRTATVTWSDGVTAEVDLSPVITKGNVFVPLAEQSYFVAKMRIATDKLGLDGPTVRTCPLMGCVSGHFPRKLKPNSVLKKREQI